MRTLGEQALNAGILGAGAATTSFGTMLSVGVPGWMEPTVAFFTVFFARLALYRGLNGGK